MNDESAERTRLRAALLQRFIDRVPELTDRFLSLFGEEISAYGGVDTAPLVPEVAAALHLIVRALADERPLSDEDLRFLREYGEMRARQGVPLAAVLQGWQIIARESIPMMVAWGREVGMADADMMDLTAELLVINNSATLTFGASHQETAAAMARHDGIRRAEFLRRLLLEGQPGGRVRIEAQQFGLQPDRLYRVLRAQTPDLERLPELEAALDRHPACRPPAGLVALVDGEVIGLSDRTPEPPADAVLGLGPRVNLDGFPGSFRAAGRAAATARAFGLTGVHRLEDLGLLPAVMADAEIGDAMIRRYLEPLGEGRAASALLETLGKYLECGMHVGRTAAAMVVHENTVRYRITRYESLTGASLRDTHTALQIWWALRRSQGLVESASGREPEPESPPVSGSVVSTGRPHSP